MHATASPSLTRPKTLAETVVWVQNGEKVVYQTSQGEKLLHGEIRVDRDGPCGILCDCCNKVISCSQFEAHAGRGSRRSEPPPPPSPPC